MVHIHAVCTNSCTMYRPKERSVRHRPVAGSTAVPQAPDADCQGHHLRDEQDVHQAACITDGVQRMRVEEVQPADDQDTQQNRQVARLGARCALSGCSLRTAAQASAPAANCMTILGSQLHGIYRSGRSPSAAPPAARRRRWPARPGSAPASPARSEDDQDQRSKSSRYASHSALIDHAGPSQLGTVEVGLEPQLDEEQLTHIADGVVAAGVLGWNVPDVEVKISHKAARVQRDEITPATPATHRSQRK